MGDGADERAARELKARGVDSREIEAVRTLIRLIGEGVDRIESTRLAPEPASSFKAGK